MSSQQTQPQVRKRRVFYIPGYDPIPPRRYRELYRRESRSQAAISGYEIEVIGKTDGGAYGWRVLSHQDGVSVETEIEVLVWADIVKDSMARSILVTYFQMVQTAWIYISTGTLWRLMQLRKGPVIAALYPVGMLLAQLALALLVGWGVAVGLGTFMWWWSVLPAAVAVYALMRWFRAIDNRLFAYYLMHDYAHSARLKGAYSPELTTRLDQFSDQILQALGSDVDEVLVVGHSSGAHLGVTALAEVLRRQGKIGGPALSFLSLGQVVPMVSFLPKARALRTDLQYLSGSEGLAWVDVSAPGDGCAFALCDPVAVSGVSLPNKCWPLVLSAAFTQTLSSKRWKQLRWRFFRLHFQYLCAFDRPNDYDYFKITAGPQTLGERFANRTPSRSRIERTISKHTTVAA
ncbi:hypothetical protein K3740_07975 [Ruegeria conchae]|uniref:hypothetical protein n=1 Tax=Ruegeria conchae TaxID=981384 RepID=UPI0021A4ABBB|nr:hypothetical protein [Ruegeria conchae]UWR04606.1 hypothetical protein K3740_07975 [Ruegeria conchae]